MTFYDISELIPPRLELWFLTKVIRRDSKECGMYRDLDRLEHVLGNGASVEELRAFRDEKIPEIYETYQNEIKTDFMPYFHGRITRIKVALNERVDAIEREHGCNGSEN